MKTSHKHDWTAPASTRLPDFIICGAMKCGTSTVHTLLNTHPDVYIPSSEINFFDMDDLFQHPDFNFRGKKNWQWPNITEKPQAYWDWYQKFFEDAPEDCLLGEDSTCYLPSLRAAHRISLQPKSIKTIICLRQPTHRAYSQYWHMLRTGRALFNFEDTIRFTPHYILERSMYFHQIIEFTRHIPKDQIFFFVLEEFRANKEHVIKNLSDFLSLDYEDLPKDAFDTHSNKAMIPKRIDLQAFKNRIARSFGNTVYSNKMPFDVEAVNSNSLFSITLNKFHDIINPLQQQPPPKMEPGTERFLNQYFQRELQGLGDFIGVDLDRLWFHDKAGG
jgi:hypothetical protein